jgi:hypothetical protein
MPSHHRWFPSGFQTTRLSDILLSAAWWRLFSDSPLGEVILNLLGSLLAPIATSDLQKTPPRAPTSCWKWHHEEGHEAFHLSALPPGLLCHQEQLKSDWLTALALSVLSPLFHACPQARRLCRVRENASRFCPASPDYRRHPNQGD